MACRKILGFYIKNRVNNTVKLQDILTKYGCSIKTRIGLHAADEEVCSPDGLIILEVLDNSDSAKLENELKSVPGIDMKKMEFIY